MRSVKSAEEVRLSFLSNPSAGLSKVMSYEEIAVATRRVQFPNKFQLEFTLLSNSEGDLPQKILFTKKAAEMNFDVPGEIPDLMNKIVRATIDNRVSSVVFLSAEKSEKLELAFSTEVDSPVFGDVRTKLVGFGDSDPKRFALLLESLSSHFATRLSTFRAEASSSGEASSLMGSDSCRSSSDEEVANQTPSKWEIMSTLEKELPILAALIEYFVAFFTKLLAAFSYEQKDMPPIFRA